MLARARVKTGAANLQNVDFVEAEMQALPWERRFDVAVCSFGIFFDDDMDAELARIARTVKPNGRVMITSFAKDYMEPMRSLFIQRSSASESNRRLRRGSASPTPKAAVICSPTPASSTSTSKSRTSAMSCPAPEQWWEVVYNAGFRRMITRVPEAEQAAFKAQHLAEVEALRAGPGIAMPVPVLFSSGRVGG